ncbi:MAG: hypothetical protein EPO21_07315 [Chloroflexota bacterium]|nr:MAG: hypothetical protein EPO21_07315 [Chloroflexota bacterium]
MELRHYLRLISAHKLLVLVITVVAALATLAGTYVISPTYAAAARVQVLPGEQDSQSWVLRSGDQINLPMMRDPTETFTQSTIEFITSRPVAEEVVRRLHLDKPEQPTDWIDRIRSEIRHLRNVAWDVVRYGEYKVKDPFEGAVDDVQHALKGKLVKSTYMFELVAKAKKPDLAARLANTAVDIALEQGTQISRQNSQEQRTYLEGQLQRQLDTLRAAQKDINDFRQSDGILNDAEQVTALVQSRYATQDQYDRTTSDLAQAEARLAEVKQQLADTPSEVTAATETTDSSTSQDQEQKGTSIIGASTITTTVTNSGSQDGDTTLSTSDPGANSKSTTKGSSSSRSESTQSVPSSTTETTQTGSNSTRATSNSRTTTPNPIYQNLLQTRLDQERQIQSLKVAQAQLSDSLQAKDREIADWIQRDVKLSDLRREETLAKEAYVRIKTAVTEAMVFAARPTQQMRIMEQAVPPLYPSQPLRGIYVLGALAAGLLVGVTLSLFIEYYKMAIHTAVQAQEVLDLPVLVRVPKLGKKRPESKPDADEEDGHS